MIYLATDHRGMIRKEEVKKFLDELKEEYFDAGNVVYDPADDEVSFVNNASQRMEDDIASGKKNIWGIFFCGSGVMVDIGANRYPNVRACLAFSEKEIKMARNDDDVNVLCIGTDFFDLEETKKFVQIFLKTPFSGEERFLRRIEKLKK